MWSELQLIWRLYLGFIFSVVRTFICYTKDWRKNRDPKTEKMKSEATSKIETSVDLEAELETYDFNDQNPISFGVQS